MAGAKELYNQRAMRLESVKLAAQIVCSTHGKDSQVMPLAQKIFDFVTNGEDDEQEY